MNEDANRDSQDTQSPNAHQDVPLTDDKAGASAERAEKGGPKGPEPTRYGDWESGGRCTDF